MFKIIAVIVTRDKHRCIEYFYVAKKKKKKLYSNNRKKYERNLKTAQKEQD